MSTNKKICGQRITYENPRIVTHSERGADIYESATRTVEHYLAIIVERQNKRTNEDGEYPIIDAVYKTKQSPIRTNDGICQTGSTDNGSGWSWGYPHPHLSKGCTGPRTLYCLTETRSTESQEGITPTPVSDAYHSGIQSCYGRWAK